MAEVRGPSQNESPALDGFHILEKNMSRYDKLKQELRDSPRTWLVTGVAGFIGSNLLLELLMLGQRVTGLDNLSTGSRRNLDAIRDLVGPEKWRNFSWIEGDITDQEVGNRACKGVEFVLHQAALGSVPRSIKEPGVAHHNNVDGFVTMLSAARDAGVLRFVYASSSAVYGDHPALPKVEERIGECLSPYAVSKRVNELYAAVFTRCYGMRCTGLRYFNVFGPRQDPDGPYAAVIPKWIDAMLSGKEVWINGDGETSRDFCYVENVVQANLLAAAATGPQALDAVFNVAAGGRTTLNELYELLRVRLVRECPQLAGAAPLYRAFQEGDVRHSNADISRAEQLLGYRVTHEIGTGLDHCLDWYREDRLRNGQEEKQAAPIEVA